MGENTGQRTRGGKIMDGAGRDGQHRTPPGETSADRGERTRIPSDARVGQKSGHDIQDSVPKPDKRADISTQDRDHDLDDD